MRSGQKLFFSGVRTVVEPGAGEMCYANYELARSLAFSYRRQNIFDEICATKIYSCGAADWIAREKSKRETGP